jgi:nitroreductase
MTPTTTRKAHFEVLKTRRTIRSYTAEPVARADLEELIQNAVLAPTGMNFQPWAFTVVTSREVMRRLNEIAVGILRRPEALQGMPQRMREIVNAPGYCIFYNAPALIAIAGDTKVPGAIYDCQLAAENLFLAAHAKGLGTCYMGFLQLAADHPEAHELLRLPPGFKMMAAAIVGHPDVRPAGPPKTPPRIAWVP